MFHDNMTKLFSELHIDGEIPKDMETISLDLDTTSIDITNEPPGIQLSADLGPINEETNNEELYSKLLRGNFLGQATSGSVLGLDESASHIIIHHEHPIIRSYREFRDVIEDFVNTVSFWREEMSGHSTI